MYIYVHIYIHSIFKGGVKKFQRRAGESERRRGQERDRGREMTWPFLLPIVTKKMNGREGDVRGNANNGSVQKWNGVGSCQWYMAQKEMEGSVRDGEQGRVKDEGSVKGTTEGCEDGKTEGRERGERGSTNNGSLCISWCMAWYRKRW